jgi:hypothetical protein
VNRLIPVGTRLGERSASDLSSLNNFLVIIDSYLYRISSPHYLCVVPGFRDRDSILIHHTSYSI